MVGVAFANLLKTKEHLTSHSTILPAIFSTFFSPLQLPSFEWLHNIAIRKRQYAFSLIIIWKLQYFLHCKHVTRHTFPKRQFRVFIPLVQAEKHHSFNMKQDKKNEWRISSLKVTWSSRVSLCKNIPAGKAKRKQSLIQTFYETSAAHCLID